MLQVGYGSNASLHLAFESSIGVLPGTPKPKKLSFVSEDIKGSRTLGQNMALVGDPNPLDSIPLRIDAAGPLVLQPGPKTAALIWKWICSDITSDATGDPNDVHVSKLKPGPPLTATLDIGFEDLASARWKHIIGAAVDQVTVAIGPDGFVQHQLTIVGLETAKENALMSGSPHDFTGDGFFHHGQIAASDILIDAARAELSSVSLTLNLNLDKSIYVIGGLGKRKGLGRQRAAITGQIRAYLVDDSIWTYLKAGAYHNVACKWAIDANTYLNIELPRTLLQETDPSANGPGAIMLDFQLQSSRDPTAASAIVATTGNDETGVNYAT